jgi:hypothetical protein
LARLLAHERIWEANPQGLLPLKRNQEGLGDMELRRRDPDLREVNMEIKKRSRGTLERCKDLIRIKK